MFALVLSSCGGVPIYRHNDTGRIVSLGYAGSCEEATIWGEEIYRGFVDVYKESGIEDENRVINTVGDSRECAVVYGIEHDGESMPMVIRVMPLPVFQSQYRPE